MNPDLLDYFECKKCKRRLTNIGGRCDYRDCDDVEKEIIDRADALIKALCTPELTEKRNDYR